MTASESDQNTSRPDAAPHSTTLSPGEKVKIFRQLFRGRDDVYPIRFVSKATGRAGYAPACANKFRRGVCELPKVKCSECGVIRLEAALFLGISWRSLGRCLLASGSGGRDRGVF
jgi:hypothetical protein